MSFGGGENLCFVCWETVRLRYKEQRRKLRMQEMGNVAVFGVLDGILNGIGKLGVLHLKMRVFL
jgi:hypothetical protein